MRSSNGRADERISNPPIRPLHHAKAFQLPLPCGASGFRSYRTDRILRLSAANLDVPLPDIGSSSVKSEILFSVIPLCIHNILCHRSPRPSASNFPRQRLLPPQPLSGKAIKLVSSLPTRRRRFSVPSDCTVSASHRRTLFATPLLPAFAIHSSYPSPVTSYFPFSFSRHKIIARYHYLKRGSRRKLNFPPKPSL